MTTDLIEDTGILLAIDMTAAPTGALDDVSRTVITWIFLDAKADAYNLRVTRALAAAANLGATLEQLADSAGLAADDVVARFRAHPGMLSPTSRARFGITFPAPVPAPAPPSWCP